MAGGVSIGGLVGGAGVGKEGVATGRSFVLFEMNSLKN